MTQATKLNILKYGAIGLIGFGLLNFLSLLPVMRPLMGWFMNFAFWTPFGSDHQVAADTARLWIAISGGLLAGWGATLLLVTTQVFPLDPAVGRRIVLSGILTWFLIDSAGSVVAGAPFNVVMNLSFLVLFALPVASPMEQSVAATQTA